MNEVCDGNKDIWSLWQATETVAVCWQVGDGGQEMVCGRGLARTKGLIPYSRLSSPGLDPSFWNRY